MSFSERSILLAQAIDSKNDNLIESLFDEIMDDSSSENEQIVEVGYAYHYADEPSYLLVVLHELSRRNEDFSTLINEAVKAANSFSIKHLRTPVCTLMNTSALSTERKSFLLLQILEGLELKAQSLVLRSIETYK